MLKNPARRPTIGMWYFIIPALFIFAADQISKLAIVKYLPLGGTDSNINVIDGIFSIVHVTNSGAAWGILDGRTYFLSSIAIITLVALWLFRHELGFQYKSVKICTGIFVGGVLGNLLDRVCYGHVVDFLDFYIPYANYRWPAFNVADCGIFIGVFFYIFLSMTMLEKEDKTKLRK